MLPRWPLRIRFCSCGHRFDHVVANKGTQSPGTDAIWSPRRYGSHDAPFKGHVDNDFNRGTVWGLRVGVDGKDVSSGPISDCNALRTILESTCFL